MSDDRFQDLLPLYVDGEISPQDRAWMEQELSVNPEAHRELRWFRVLRAGMRGAELDVPETIGWAAVSARIRSEQRGVLHRLRALVFGEGASDGAPAGFLGLRPGFALAGLAVLVLQAGTIVGLVYERQSADGPGIKVGATSPATEGPLLAVVFSSDTTEKDLRLMLVDVRGSLVSGPGQLGKYYVRVPKGDEQTALQTLKAQPRVESVELVPAVPVDP